ncbi:Signal peptidase I [Rickettsiales bacterium Ac37b]|nr:Signal peptidase I [Rickettsiales bacterium Ac37b]
MLKRDKAYYGEFFRTFLVAIIVALVFRSFVYEPYHVPSGSMKPTLIDGDYIFVSKFSYGYSRYSLPLGLNLFAGRVAEFAHPERGDVIVFRNPYHPSVNYIKRLIGLPGDKIQVMNGVVYINGVAVEQIREGTFIDGNGKHIEKYVEVLPNGVSYNVLKDKERGPLDNTKIYTVPKDKYFFMGDNRDNSIDSRFLDKVGYVPYVNIVGKAQLIFFSSKSSLWAIWTWLYDLNLDRFFTKLAPKQVVGNNFESITDRAN